MAKFVALTDNETIVYILEAESFEDAERKFGDIELIQKYSFQVHDVGEFEAPTRRHIWTKIFSLNKQMRGIAGVLVEQAKTHEFDDILQEMRIALYQRATTDPLFIRCLDAYILTQANWAGKHFCESDRFFAKVNVVIEDNPMSEEGDDAAMDFFEMQPDESGSPEEITLEQEYAQAVAEIVASLPEYQRKIVRMLADGYQQREIAKEMKLLESTISMAKKVIQKAVWEGLMLRDLEPMTSPVQLTMGAFC